jgi:hypothetical protein
MSKLPEKLTRDARRRVVVKRMFEVLGWLAAVALFAFAGRAVLAAEGAGQSHERPAAAAGQDAPAERRTRERTARERREELSPAAIAREARTVFVRPTRHLDKKYLEYKLHKYPELREWGLALVEDERAADLVISIDKAALNYIFTVTDPRTSVIVTSGKAVAINGLVAAEYLGREIIKKLKDVRAASDRRPRKKRPPEEDYDEDEESESSEVSPETDTLLYTVN